MRPVGAAHELAEVEPHVARNFTPALPRFELRYDVIEALARGLGQQVRIPQVAIAEPRRRLLRLKRVHGNALSRWKSSSRDWHGLCRVSSCAARGCPAKLTSLHAGIIL